MTDLEERTATDLRARLDTGVVIPAHPLALDDRGGLDLTAQRARTRYQLAAGAHGRAVGVHTTQFELHHDPGMLRTVWELAALTAARRRRGNARSWSPGWSGTRPRRSGRRRSPVS